MKNILLVSAIIFSSFHSFSQTNFVCANPLAEKVLLGKYNPSQFKASKVHNHPDTISRGINKRVSPDSLHKYLIALASFRNRNTGSDTVSQTKGIGAARRWVYKKFQEISRANENRLLPSYFQFDQAICNASQHKNVIAVLPGTDTTDRSIIIVEGHIDSRCETSCDTSCLAQGMEDNASGTALVIELARVMSKYSYNHTIVFMLPIAEEQGLFGANAFAEYCKQKNIAVKAVFNNDVIGGVICGNTSSPPICSPAGSIDSTHVRIFSDGSFNSFNKQLARFVKLEYKEQLMSRVAVPMTINIMTLEDRSARGGDHIPFRKKGFTAIRFTSQNEHGNAHPDSTYTDRQHSLRDILGIDKNKDGIIDDFYVHFNYLARNTVINGNAIGMAAISPKTPDFTVTNPAGTKARIAITQQSNYKYYRVGVRTITNDWDSVYTISPASSLIDLISSGTYFFSVASVDAKGVESFFSKELPLQVGDNTNKQEKFSLLQTKPSPFDEAVAIYVLVNDQIQFQQAYISITDQNGKEIKQLPITLNLGMNEVIFKYGNRMKGTYSYTLMIDGKAVQSKTMIFSN